MHRAGMPAALEKPGGALCSAHQAQQRKLGIDLETFRVHPDVTPHRSMGPCLAAACTRDRFGRGLYCTTHAVRWTTAKREQPGIDEGWFRRTVPPITEEGRVSLRGLTLRVAAEIVYAVQERCRANIKTTYLGLRPIVCHALLHQVHTLSDLPVEGLNTTARSVRNQMVNHVEMIGLTPETERRKDRWNAAVFGHRGNLRFTDISQPWLRESAKRWALEVLPRRRGDQAAASIQGELAGLAQLSDSLRLQRADHGDNPQALRRADVDAFTNRLAYLQQTAELSARQRFDLGHNARRLLSRMRMMGLTVVGLLMCDRS